MNRTIRKLVAAGIFVASAGLLPAHGEDCNVEQQGYHCGRQCGAQSGLCDEESNSDRACWDSAGACGESATYDCCQGGQGGF